MGPLTTVEHPLMQPDVAPSPPHNDSFYHDTRGLIVSGAGSLGTYRSALDVPRDLTDAEVWIRAAEVYEGSVPADATGFNLGLEDMSRVRAWLDSDDVGGVPRPYDRRAFDMNHPGINKDHTKTMLTTLRFPTGCFRPEETSETLALNRIVAILIRPRADRRPLAADQLQIVTL